jgi:hypothetical protein
MTPDTGPSTTPNEESDSIPPSFNPDAHDDDIAWLNIAENDEAQKVIDVCVERW